MTMPERRSRQRTNPNELVYLDMGSENGGIVLNVSEGGLAFCAAFPIRQTEVIQFSLLVKGKGRMSGAGGVAWRDQSGKMCGLRLNSDSADGSERLIRWAMSPYVTTLAPSPAVLPAAAVPAEAHAPAATVTAGVSSLFFPTEPLCAGPTPPAPKRERGPFDALTAEDLAAMPTGLQFTTATALGAMLVALLVVVLGAGAYSNGTTPERSRVEASDYAGAQSNPQPKAAATSLSTPKGGASELEAALEYLRAPDGQRDTTSATRLLQAAVKSGSSPAGVFLAEMYLSGEGIRKDCTDARALLAAASRKRNIEASVKLEELVVRGCR